ncbi:MAG: hypothetical protein V3V61_01610 [Gammaproteobacteria bacterium]
MKRQGLGYLAAMMVIFLPLQMGYALEFVPGEAEVIGTTKSRAIDVAMVNLSLEDKSKAGTVIPLYRGQTQDYLYSTAGRWELGDSFSGIVNWAGGFTRRDNNRSNFYNPSNSISAYEGGYLALIHTSSSGNYTNLYLAYGKVPEGNNTISTDGSYNNEARIYVGGNQRMEQSVSVNDNGDFVIVNTRVNNDNSAYLYFGRHNNNTYGNNGKEALDWYIRGNKQNDNKWDGLKIIPFTGSSRPSGRVSVAFGNDGKGIIFSKDNSKLYYQSFFIDMDNLRPPGEENELENQEVFKWVGEKVTFSDDYDFNPDDFTVDINSDGLVVGIGTEDDEVITYFYGQLKDDFTIDFEVDKTTDTTAYWPGISITSEGYVLDLFSGSGKIVTSHLSVFAGEQVIEAKEDDNNWQADEDDNDEPIYKASLNNPSGIYTFGFFAKDSDLVLTDDDGEILWPLEEIEADNYYTVTAHTLTLKLKGPADKTIDELISTVTVNPAKSDYQIFNQAILDDDDKDITELLGGKSWQDNEVTFDKVFDSDELLTLGFSALDHNCVRLSQEGKAIFSAGNTLGEDNYYLVDVQADENGTLKLALDAARCNSAEEAISTVEIFTDTAEETFVREIPDSDWTNGKILIPALAPQQVYVLEDLRFDDTETALKSLEGETLINKPEIQEVYTINRTVNSKGDVHLHLPSPEGHGLITLSSEIRLTRPRATTIASFEEGDTKDDEGHYVIAGSGVYSVRACFTNEDAEISYEKDGDKFSLFKVSGDACRVDSLVLTGETVLSASEDIGKIEVYKQAPLFEGFSLPLGGVPPSITLTAGLAAKHSYILRVETTEEDAELKINGELEKFEEKDVYIFPVTADAQGEIFLTEIVGNTDKFGEMELYLPSTVGHIAYEDWRGDRQSIAKPSGLSASSDYNIGFTASSTADSNIIIIEDHNNNKKAIEIPVDLENELDYFWVTVKSDEDGMLYLRLRDGYGLKSDIEDRLSIISIYRKDNDKDND